MNVQRILVPGSTRRSWLVLGDDFLPVAPIQAFLAFQRDLGRSPNTVRAHAFHLKAFWEYLRDTGVGWEAVDVAYLAGFIPWLRCGPAPPALGAEAAPPRRGDATIDLMLTSVHQFYDFHARRHTGPDLPLYRFVTLARRQYKPFLYGLAKTRPDRRRVVRVKRPQHLPRTLTAAQVQALLDACARRRDRLLVALLHDTGMRIGQALGLRHADIAVEDNAIRIVPRDDNANGARAKTDEAYTVFPAPAVLDLYVEYIVEELDGLAAAALPEYVFVNLWEGAVGRPLTYATVVALFRRLSAKVGFHARPHMLRHTRATTWIRDDRLPIPTVARLLGHRSAQTTSDLYLHLTADDLRAELDAARAGESGADER
ncbi:MAG TPA: tyrosine-type recombinase/integrase [Thermomicrobiales bacterium]|nr:tyrosine-type recombinase/integrase [Thermomicrobiales bacterium]